MAIIYIEQDNPCCDAIRMTMRALGQVVDYRNVDEFEEHKRFVEENYGDVELPLVFNEHHELISIGYEADKIAEEFGVL